MRYLLKTSRILVAIAVAAFASGSGAQEGFSKYSCQSFGGGAPEPLGDDLLISTDQYTCHVDSGPMSGGVLTGETIWKWNGPDAVLVSGSGIVRKEGAAWVFVQTEGKIAVTMVNGKATGFGASGKGRIAAATGGAVSKAGRTTTWTVAPSGLRQFTVEERTD
jgi:hypothetical protein